MVHTLPALSARMARTPRRGAASQSEARGQPARTQGTTEGAKTEEEKREEEEGSKESEDDNDCNKDDKGNKFTLSKELET